MQNFPSFASMNLWGATASKMPAHRAQGPAAVGNLRSHLRAFDPRAVRLAACARAAQLKGWPSPGASGGGAPVRLLINSPAPLIERSILIKLKLAQGTLTLAFEREQWVALASAARIDDHNQRNAVCELLLAEMLPLLADFDWHADAPLAASATELAAAAAAASATVSASASAAETSAAPSSVAFTLDGRRIDVLDADDRLIDAVERGLDHRQFTRNRLPRNLALQCRFGIGERRFARNRLASLVDGDVVLIRCESPGLGAAGLAMHPLAGNLAWGSRHRPHLRTHCIAQAANMTIEDSPALTRPDEPSMDEMADPVDIGQLEVPVQFEIDGPVLTLAEIGALGAGQVLQLPIAVDRALVSLRVDGQLVGRGHLVSVGGWLGVQLVGRGGGA